MLQYVVKPVLQRKPTDPLRSLSFPTVTRPSPDGFPRATPFPSLSRRIRIGMRCVMLRPVECIGFAPNRLHERNSAVIAPLPSADEPLTVCGSPHPRGILHAIAIQLTLLPCALCSSYCLSTSWEYLAHCAVLLEYLMGGYTCGLCSSYCLSTSWRVCGLSCCR